MLHRHTLPLALILCLTSGAIGQNRAVSPLQVLPADVKPIIFYAPGWDWVNIEWYAYYVWMGQMPPRAKTGWQPGYISEEPEQVAFEGDFTPDVLTSHLAIFCPDHAIVSVNGIVLPFGPGPDPEPQDPPATFEPILPSLKPLAVSLTPGVTYRVRVDYDNLNHFAPEFSGVTLIAWSGMEGEGGLDWGQIVLRQAAAMPTPAPLFAAFPIGALRLFNVAVSSMFWARADLAAPTGNLTSSTIDPFARKTATQLMAEDNPAARAAALRGAAAGGVRLSIKTDKTAYTVGENIALTVTLTNISKADFENFVLPPLLSYQIALLYEGKDKVALTAYGKRQASQDTIISIPSYPIAPGASETFPLRLNRLFDMSMDGRYTIKVSRTFAYINTNGKREIANPYSNTINFEVDEPENPKPEKKH